MTDHHAQRFAELKKPIIRLAFDDIKTESKFQDAYDRLKSAGIPNKSIQVYVLIGFDDTPEDALYRLRRVRGLGIKPNPMRYQPIHAMTRNEYTGGAWTPRELTRFVRYWANLRFTEAVPFEDFERVPVQQVEVL